MSCLGGTAEEPRTWVRYFPDGRVQRIEGRICSGKRFANPHTSRRGCAACPAFRGLRWDGTVANGLGTDNETPVGLTPDEYTRYAAAIEASLYDDDYEPLFLWYSRQDRELVTRSDGTHVVMPGIGQRGLLRIGDPGALDRDAARARAWRAAHPGADKRKRKRDRAAYMRDYRKRNPVKTGITTAQGDREPAEELKAESLGSRAGGAGARAREAGTDGVTEEVGHG